MLLWQLEREEANPLPLSVKLTNDNIPYREYRYGIFRLIKIEFTRRIDVKRITALILLIMILALSATSCGSGESIAEVTTVDNSVAGTGRIYTSRPVRRTS